MVLGRTGREQATVSKRMTFCSLCRKKIEAGEACLSLNEGNQFLIHNNCDDAEVQNRVSNGEFRKSVKRRKRRKR